MKNPLILPKLTVIIQFSQFHSHRYYNKHKILERLAREEPK